MSEVLKQEGLPASVYVNALHGFLEKDWIYWEYETLWDEAKEVLGFDLQDSIKAKIKAYRACLNSTLPFVYWSIFLNTCGALNGFEVDPDVVRIYTPPQLLWTVSQMNEISPENEFGFDVKGMIAVMLFDYGIRWLPEPFGEMFNERLRELMDPEDRDLIDEIAEAYRSSSFNFEGDAGDADILEIALSRIIPIENYIEINKRLEKGALNVQPD